MGVDLGVEALLLRLGCASKVWQLTPLERCLANWPEEMPMLPNSHAHCLCFWANSSTCSGSLPFLLHPNLFKNFRGFLLIAQGQTPSLRCGTGVVATKLGVGLPFQQALLPLIG